MGEFDGDVEVRRTDALADTELAEIRELLEAAFAGTFDETDWQHTVGGVHLLARREGALLAHAAVVPRRLVAGARPLSVGYVEGVATRPDVRRRGQASRVMRAAGQVIRDGHELGALSADVPELYSRLGWEPWRGRTYVDAPAGRVRTAEDDDGVMVLRTPRTADLDVTSDLICDWRPGDVW
jgi:aminoglycoside 2'-N-acetyltransferase I